MHLETLCHTLFDLMNEDSEGTKLVRPLVRPHHMVAQHKPRHKIEGLDVLVPRLEKVQAEGDVEWVEMPVMPVSHPPSFDSGDYFSALCRYYTALVELYPWTSTPLLFTYHEACEYGIAQL